GLSTSIILVEINDTGQLIGIIVDAVEDVLHLVQEEEYVRNALEPDDRIAEANQQITWLKGIVTTEGRMVLILEVGALLSYQEQYQLRQILAHNIQFMF
ncbi:MAG TPA: chemotaxis protein CheW, partial [Anaerolineae bacterium]|nr:chemotaxis protein CheW [Anaerolineae bacterium]